MHDYVYSYKCIFPGFLVFKNCSYTDTTYHIIKPIKLSHSSLLMCINVWLFPIAVGTDDNAYKVQEYSISVTIRTHFMTWNVTLRNIGWNSPALQGSTLKFSVIKKAVMILV